MEHLKQALISSVLPGAKLEHPNPQVTDGIFFTDRKGRMWWYDSYDEFGQQGCSAFIQRPEDECGSDDDPDWELEGDYNFWLGLVALLIDIKEGKV